MRYHYFAGFDILFPFVSFWMKILPSPSRKTSLLLSSIQESLFRYNFLDIILQWPYLIWLTSYNHARCPKSPHTSHLYILVYSVSTPADSLSPAAAHVRADTTLPTLLWNLLLMWLWWLGLEDDIPWADLVGVPEPPWADLLGVLRPPWADLVGDVALPWFDFVGKVELPCVDLCGNVELLCVDFVGDEELLCEDLEECRWPEWAALADWGGWGILWLVNCLRAWIDYFFLCVLTIKFRTYRSSFSITSVGFTYQYPAKRSVEHGVLRSSFRKKSLSVSRPALFV